MLYNLPVISKASHTIFHQSVFQLNRLSVSRTIICILSCIVSHSSSFSASRVYSRGLKAQSVVAMSSINPSDTMEIQAADHSVASSVPRSPRKRTASSPKKDDSSTITKKKVTKTTKASTPKTSSDPFLETNNINHQELLQNWFTHSHHSYHIETFLSPPQAYAIRHALVNWYRLNRRKLPWRGDVGPFDGSTAGFAEKKKSNGKKSGVGKDIRSFFGKKDSDDGEEKKEEDIQQSVESKVDGEMREVSAYGVWVSEIMLQQTRVEAVIPYYLKWMESFPTVEALANATPEEVNSHWAGLGFYRRARLLHQGAKRVVEDYDGVVPNTVEELMKVEGIGRYTASAVASIAYGVEVPVVDGNVCRVLSRLTGVANHIKAGVLKDDLGWLLAERIVQAKPCDDDKATNELIGTPGEVNQALMELGATYCCPSGTGIEDGDPLKQFYISTQLGVAVGKSIKSGNFLSTQRDLVGAHKSECKLCDPDGVSSVFFDISDRISDSSKQINLSAEIVSAMSGHSAIPMPPPKKAKREEVIAVGVIRLEDTNSNNNSWLMVNRPPEGLLAGQWEFPSKCLWTSSDKEKKAKSSSSKSAGVQVPCIDASVRSAELDSYLFDILHSPNSATKSKKNASLTKRVQVNDPIVHVFSHVCHTMWVEHGRVNGNHINTEKRWKLRDGREAGWFTEDDMLSVGITSGVRKVLALTGAQK